MWGRPWPATFAQYPRSYHRWRSKPLSSTHRLPVPEVPQIGREAAQMPPAATPRRLPGPVFGQAEPRCPAELLRQTRLQPQPGLDPMWSLMTTWEPTTGARGQDTLRPQHLVYH